MATKKPKDVNANKAQEDRSGNGVCFVIARIGHPGSAERRELDGLLSSVVEPVLSEVGLRPEVAHLLSSSGAITNQIIQHLVVDELVIANITGLNPNVMYELAIRHAYRKPIVTLVENGTDLPFDLKADRTLFYDNDMKGVSELLEQLPRYVKTALADLRPESPISRATDLQVAAMAPGTTDAQATLINMVAGLDAKLDALDRSSARPYGARKSRNRDAYFPAPPPTGSKSFAIDLDDVSEVVFRSVLHEIQRDFSNHNVIEVSGKYLSSSGSAVISIAGPEIVLREAEAYVVRKISQDFPTVTFRILPF